MYSSGAPSEAKPISCRAKHYISLTSANHESGTVLTLTWENCAKLGLQNNGTCPSSSWQTSLKRKKYNVKCVTPLFISPSLTLSLPPPTVQLTVQVCTLALIHDGCTGSSETLGRPVQLESHERRVGQQLGGAESQCNLLRGRVHMNNVSEWLLLTYFLYSSEETSTHYIIVLLLTYCV